MFRFARTFARQPLRIVGVLWPLALLAPFVPGLPRPSNGGPTWRQEASVAESRNATVASCARTPATVKRRAHLAAGGDSRVPALRHARAHLAARASPTTARRDERARLRANAFARLQCL